MTKKETSQYRYSTLSVLEDLERKKEGHDCLYLSPSGIRDDKRLSVSRRRSQRHNRVPEDSAHYRLRNH